MTGLQVRSMTAVDLPAVVGMERAAFTEPWDAPGMAAMQADPLAYCPVADMDGVVVGYAFAWVVGDEVHLANLAVSPLHRRRGIGRALSRAVLAEGRRRGAETCFLEVRRSNRAAIALYEDLGFVRIGVRARYYPDNQEDALLMARRT